MKKIGIIGATGYTGEELLRILSGHPEVSVSFVTSAEDIGQPLTHALPRMQKYRDLPIADVEDVMDARVDLVFMCLPAGYSAPLAESYHKKGVKVIDLGADFRFSDAAVFKQWYGMDHHCPALLKDAVYGLPEWNRQAISKTKLVSNPGCYPTSVLLPLIPFLKAGVLSDEPVVVDSKSGISGAGSTVTKKTQYGEVDQNVRAYSPGRVHRHVGEMEDQCSRYTEKNIRILFTPHLIPMFRGIFSTIYVRLRKNMERPDLLSILKDSYVKEPFVQIMDSKLPETKWTLYSNLCFIAAETVAGTNTAILFSAIDNLGKGASSQAVQNMNIMFGFQEDLGLA